MLLGRCHCGACGWRLAGDPGSITACNCTLCRRYGALWAYGFEGDTIEITGDPSSYRRAREEAPSLEILFCSTCAAVRSWRSLAPWDNGFKRMAVNIRLAEPDTVSRLPIDHFDGLDSFKDLPSQGKCVRDLWF